MRCLEAWSSIVAPIVFNGSKPAELQANPDSGAGSSKAILMVGAKQLVALF